MKHSISNNFFLLFLILIFNTCIAHCQNEEVYKTPWTVDWSPNGNFIAIGGEIKGLKIYNENLDILKSIPFDNNITRIKWHPSNDILAIVTQLQSDSSKGRLYHLKTDKWINLKGLKEGARGLSWSHTGDYLAVGDNNGYVSIYKNNGEFIRKFKADPKIVAGLSWHPQKEIMVSVGSEIGIYDIQGNSINKFMPDSLEIFMLSVEWHPTENYFAVGDYGDSQDAINKRIIIWKPDGTKIREITGSKGEFRNIRWDSNGDKIAGATDALRIWDKNGKLITESNSSNDFLWGIDWSPDGKYLITSSANGLITLWDENAKTIKIFEY